MPLLSDSGTTFTEDMLDLIQLNIYHILIERKIPPSAACTFYCSKKYMHVFGFQKYT